MPYFGGKRDEIMNDGEMHSQSQVDSYGFWTEVWKHSGKFYEFTFRPTHFRWNSVTITNVKEIEVNG